MNPKKKAVVLFSGGLDSTVLLYKLLHDGYEVIALSLFYGQRHARELLGARTIASRAGVEHIELDLSNLKPILAGSSQTSDDIPVPEGHYAEASMKTTVVPNRNMILLSIAVGLAISRKAEAVAYAAHNGDHAVYPDCRESFAMALRRAVKEADWHPPLLGAPFLTWGKDQVVTLGFLLGVPFDLTWSCYKGVEKHCGKCGTCVERREAFELAGVRDPTEYEV